MRETSTIETYFIGCAGAFYTLNTCPLELYPNGFVCLAWFQFQFSIHGAIEFTYSLTAKIKQKTSSPCEVYARNRIICSRFEAPPHIMAIRYLYRSVILLYVLLQFFVESFDLRSFHGLFLRKKSLFFLERNGNRWWAHLSFQFRHRDFSIIIFRCTFVSAAKLSHRHWFIAMNNLH